MERFTTADTEKCLKLSKYAYICRYTHICTHSCAQDGHNVLHKAVYRESLDVVKYLVKKGGQELRMSTDKVILNICGFTCRVEKGWQEPHMSPGQLLCVYVYVNTAMWVYIHVRDRGSGVAQTDKGLCVYLRVLS